MENRLQFQIRKKNSSKKAAICRLHLYFHPNAISSAIIS